MRRAMVARPRPWREFQVGDQLAFWRQGKGWGMRSGHARWHGRAIVLSVSGFKECVGDIQTSVSHGVSGTVAHGTSH